ncbi:MAG: hypothetical protein Q9162_002975 [Coniocarpon cinnabarinum]
MTAFPSKDPSKSASALQEDPASYKRLYISPLTPDILPVILSVDQQRLASESVSFHHPQTSLEKSFGYLDLPHEAADKLRKKLHGSTFRGFKMRVEESKPERGASASTRKRKADVVAENAKDEAESGKRTRRGKKPDEGVAKGEELPAGRKVKRGWDEGDKKGRSAGKDAEPEPGETKMVFRTSVPPNKTENVEEEPAKGKAHKKGKKSKENGTTLDVKEFEKTEKVPTLLRGNSKPGKTTKTTYDDEKGWVDENGNVVEEVKKTRKGSKSRKKSDQEPNDDVAMAESSKASNTKTRATAAKDAELQPPKDTTPQIAVDSTAVIDDNANDMDGPSAGAADEPTTDSPSILQSKSPSTLESLFKRPAPSDKSKSTNRPAPIQTFSFFGDEPKESGEKDDDDDGSPDPDVPIDSDMAASVRNNLRRRRLASLQIPPHTPFTRRDLDARGLRSAAPTPDTAAIGKRVKAPWKRSQTRSVSQDADSRSGSGPPGERSSLLRETIEEEAEEEEADALPGVDESTLSNDKVSDVVKIKMEQSPEGVANGSEEREQTEFEKQFYEQRGDLNRAWKSQRREAKKRTRQASNRRGRG